MIVVDTNVIASMWVPNDMDEWVYNLRKDIVEFSVVLQATEEAEQLMDANEFEVNSTQVMSLVSDSSCSAYDCEFVALADDLNVPLVTFVKKILREFPNIGIHPEEFAP